MCHKSSLMFPFSHCMENTYIQAGTHTYYSPSVCKKWQPKKLFLFLFQAFMQSSFRFPVTNNKALRGYLLATPLLVLLPPSMFFNCHKMPAELKSALAVVVVVEKQTAEECYITFNTNPKSCSCSLFPFHRTRKGL